MLTMELDLVITILGVVAVILTVLARTDALEKKLEKKIAGVDGSLNGKIDRLASELRSEMAELRNDNKVLEGRIFLLAAGMEQPPLTGSDAVANAVTNAAKIEPSLSRAATARYTRRRSR